MAFPTTSVLDTFNAGANQLLTARAGWGATVLGGGTSFRTDGGPTAAQPGVAGNNFGNFWNTSSLNGECFLTLTNWSPANNTVRICSRITVTGAAPTYYALELAATTTTSLQLIKVVAGTKTTLTANLPTTVVTGDSVGISVIGSTVTGWHKVGAGAWTQKATVTDSSITASGNVAGTHRPLGTVAHAFDNFGGGVPAAGTLFLQTVTGAASFAGIRPKLGVQRKTLGTLTYSGAVVSHPTARRVTAGFAPSGSVTRVATLARTLTGALSFSGSRSAATAYARSVAAASLSFVGTRTSVKAVTKAIGGALSFVGSSTRFPAKLLTAVLVPAGALSRVLSLFRTLTAALFPAAVLKRSTSRKLLASITPSGFFFTSTGANHFFAVFRPTGTTPTHSLPARTLFAGLQAAGSVARFTSRQLVSSLIASGVMTSQYLPPVPVPEPGGGGFGAVMDDAFFVRYQVDGKWRGVKRVRA